MIREWLPRLRTPMERRARMTKPRRRHAFYLSQRPVEPEPERTRRTAEPMSTVTRQAHYAALGRGELTPVQRRRIRRKQHRLLREAS